MNLKIYRKLMVLCVLTIGLFFAASINKAEAENSSCCEECYELYIRCINYYCQNSDRACVARYCLPDYEACLSTCDRCD